MLETKNGPNEQILWSGSKDKKVTVLESIFNPLLPFAALWGMIDLGFITGFTQASQYDGAGRITAALIPFFLIHLMPVWLYLGGVLTSAHSAKNTRYCVTDRAVYIQSGVFSTKFERFDYMQILSLEVGQSFFDQRAMTGDVRLTLDQIVYSGKRHTPHQRVVKIENIPDYQEVYQLLLQQQTAGAANAAAARQGNNFGPAPQFTAQVMGQYGNTQMPQYGNQPMPQYQNPQPRQYGNLNQVPQFGAPQYGAQQIPQYGARPVQQSGAPQVPQYGNTPAPEPEMLSLESISQPDDFKDPTLSAFDFQKDDPFGHDA